MSYFYHFDIQQIESMTMYQFRRYMQHIKTVMDLFYGDGTQATPSEVAAVAAQYGIKGPRV